MLVQDKEETTSIPLNGGLQGTPSLKRKLKGKLGKLTFNMKWFDILCTFSASFLKVLISLLLQQGGSAGGDSNRKTTFAKEQRHPLVIKKLRLEFRRWFLIVRERRSSSGFPYKGKNKNLNVCTTEMVFGFMRFISFTYTMNQIPFAMITRPWEDFTERLH